MSPIYPNIIVCLILFQSFRCLTESASRGRSVNKGNSWRRLATEVSHSHFRIDMADALTVIRQYNVEKKDVVQRDEQVIFGDFAWPSNTKTNYLIYG